MPVPPSKSKVCLFYEDTRFTLQNRSRLKKFIASIFTAEGRKLGSLNYIFCTDKALLDKNREFLGHDYYTDIITFGLSGKKEPVQGEIYISVDRVRDNARDLGISFKTELHRVIFHGVLHLCGYGDKSLKDKTRMRNKEDQYLLKYGVK